MSTFEAGDVVCLRTGGPKMVVTDWYPSGHERQYVVMWHQDDRVLSSRVYAAGLKLVESAKPEERLPVYERIRRLSEGCLDGSLATQKTLALTILHMLKESGL